MAKNDNKLTNMDLGELQKKLAISQKARREFSFELKAGKGTVLKDYRNAKKLIAQIKTELAKRS